MRVAPWAFPCISPVSLVPAARGNDSVRPTALSSRKTADRPDAGRFPCTALAPFPFSSGPGPRGESLRARKTASKSAKPARKTAVAALRLFALQALGIGVYAVGKPLRKALPVL